MLSYLTTLFTAILLIRIPEDYILFTLIYLVLQLAECNVINILCKLPVSYNELNYKIIRYIYFMVYTLVCIGTVAVSVYSIVFIDNNFLYYISIIVLVRCSSIFLLWISVFIAVKCKLDLLSIIRTDGSKLIQFLEGYYPNGI